MAIIVNVLGNNCIQSDTVDSITAANIMYICERFTSEHYVMPEEIFVVTCGKVIEMDLESMVQSELDKKWRGNFILNLQNKEKL